MRELVTFFNKQTFVISIFGINRVNFTYVNEVIMMPILGLMVFFFFLPFSRKSIWKLTYFILYKNKVVLDGHLWPALNATLIDWRIVTSSKVKVRTDVDLYYYRYMLHFKLDHKLSLSEYGNVEKAMTEQYVDQHPGIVKLV